ncbi:helix-turn-helix domain-containing protein [Amycolatopsis sp.]|uniref:TetR/AcrR family transcriptional regulator n=1 Tax=Amycolatopsis sp. TaxID=37632 RepID=UPI002BBACCCD|nr:helix-turn-helix domain-containing protein [Amycolatopsis sp.]HVV12623.1 helix-turn-helix domain-containing protein [Amycolatopsis sp.]
MSDAVNPRPTGLRAARVAETEQRILAAARDLFVRNGYAATTLAAIADAARVGHRTVYVRFDTKADLLKRVVDVAVVGDTERIDLHSRDWYRQALAAPTVAERLDRLADGTAALMARAGDVFAVAQQAEPVEPVIADAAKAGRAATRDSMRAFFTKMHSDRLLPPTADLEWLCDTAGALAHAQTYLLIRETLGLEPDRYRKWLRTTWQRLIAAASAGTALAEPGDTRVREWRGGVHRSS